MTPREAVIIHALRCREALYRGDPCPVYAGPSLVDAELREVDLTGADLFGVDLEGANLRNAVLRGAVLRGADLTAAVLGYADLRDADLTGAHLRGAYLSGAVLTGAVTDHGVIVRSDADDDGWYCWHAYTTDTGITWLQYGCDGATLDEWLGRTPEYGRRHGHRPEHWRMGPAIAIAAAVRLRDGGAA